MTGFNFQQSYRMNEILSDNTKIIGHIYKITNKKSFEIKRKKTNEELPPNYHQIKDQLEWNQKILQQKALRELRMRINL